MPLPDTYTQEDLDRDKAKARRERIATAVLGQIARWPGLAEWSHQDNRAFNDNVRAGQAQYAVAQADALIAELDKSDK